MRKITYILTLVLSSAILFGCGKEEKKDNTDYFDKAANEIASDSDAEKVEEDKSDDAYQNDFGDYYYVSNDGVIGISDYNGIVYKAYDASVSDEEVNKAYDDIVNYFSFYLGIYDITDEDIKRYYPEYESIDSLKEGLKDNIYQQNLEKADDFYRNEVLDIIDDGSDFFVDMTDAIAISYSSLKDHYLALAKAAGLSYEDYVTTIYESDIDSFEKMLAENSASLTKKRYALLAVAEKENITVSDEEYTELIAKYMYYYGYDNQLLFEEEHGLENIKNYMLEDKALDFIMESAVCE